MKTLLFILVLLASFLPGAYAQKIAIKKGVIFLDNQPYACLAADGDATLLYKQLEK